MKTRRGTTHSQSQNWSAAKRNTKANMEKRAPEGIAARDKIRHENDDPEALRTFNN
jgi:hypothetical protein